MKKILFCLIFAFAFSAISVNAQNDTPIKEEALQIQPSIIVIPMKKEGEDFRILLEDPKLGLQRRLVISRVDNAFKSRGFTTYDFMSELKKQNTTTILNDDAQLDIKDNILKNAGADVFVEADIDSKTGGSGTEVTIILKASETATGRVLASKDASSGLFYTDNIEKLAGNTIDKIKDAFLNDLQASFTDIVKNGRSIYIEFNIKEGVVINFNTEINDDGDLLSDAISSWFKKNAFKNYAKRKSGSKNQLIYDDVRIPLKDPETKLNYDIETFGTGLRKFIRSIVKSQNLKAEITYPPGQIMVKIENIE